MKTPGLDDLMTFNEQLAALIGADVQLDLGLGRSRKDVATSLEQINAAVARRVSRGASLRDALRDGGRSTPHAYRSMMLLGLRCGDLATGLDHCHGTAASAKDTRDAVRSGSFYPLLVCFLAYLGLIGFCLFFVPTLGTTYESLRTAPGPWLSMLQSLRATLPYWAPVPPVILLLSVFRQVRWGPSRPSGPAGSRWLPGMSRASSQWRHADFAEMLAELLDADTPLDEAVEIAAGACGDVGLATAAQRAARAPKSGLPPSEASGRAKRFPPLVRWALSTAGEEIDRGRALRAAATVYRESAERRTRRLQVVAPAVMCVALAGTATLLYGLALFLPVVELLRALAS